MRLIPSGFYLSLNGDSERFIWLPDTNTGQTFEPLEVQLVVNLYRKRKRSVTFFIDTSDGQQETPRAFKNKNILAEAVEYRDYLKVNPSCTTPQSPSISTPSVSVFPGS